MNIKRIALGGALIASLLSPTLSALAAELSASTTASTTVAVQAPVVSTIAPVSGVVGTNFTVTGTNLSGATKVEFYNAVTNRAGKIPNFTLTIIRLVTRPTNTRLSFNSSTVPPGAYRIKVVTADSASNLFPTIIRITPKTEVVAPTPEQVAREKAIAECLVSANIYISNRITSEFGNSGDDVGGMEALRQQLLPEYQKICNDKPESRFDSSGKVIVEPVTPPVITPPTPIDSEPIVSEPLPGGIFGGNCMDGRKNGNETGIDLGGRCGTCRDRVRNGNETGIDRGGRCTTTTTPPPVVTPPSPVPPTSPTACSEKTKIESDISRVKSRISSMKTRAQITSERSSKLRQSESDYQSAAQKCLVSISGSCEGQLRSDRNNRNASINAEYDGYLRNLESAERELRQLESKLNTCLQKKASLPARSAAAAIGFLNWFFGR